MQVDVVYALPSRCWRFPVDLPEGATVADALAAADPARHIPGLELDPQRLAVFGRPVTPATTLHPGDRVEILRPLLADPKLARRRRAGQA